MMARKRRPVPSGGESYTDIGGMYDALPLHPIPDRTSESTDALLPSQQAYQSSSGYQPNSAQHAVESALRTRQHHSQYIALPLGEADDQLAEGSHGGTDQARETSNISQHTPAQYSAIPLTEGDNEHDNGPQPTKLPRHNSNGPARPLWMPFFLRWPALLSTLVVALVLGLVVIFLLVYSTVHKGLGSDDDSSAVLFGWRFTPTLVTVLYAILTAMVFNDARRTEPFAQMSHVTGASSATSLFMAPKQWWTVLVNSFNKRENHGHINFFLLAAVLVNIISFLLINPLSSALLQSQPVDLISQVSFSQYDISQDQPLAIAASDLVYFRTIGNVLQNLSTSAWLTDRYAVVPFWPSSGASNLGTILTSRAQQWQTNATVLSVDLECETMNVHTAYWAKNFTGDDTERDFLALLLTDTQGCEVGINGYTQYMTRNGGGGSWYAPPNVTLPVWDDSNTEEGIWYHYYNSTEKCNSRQIILSTSTNVTWQGDTVDAFNKDFKARAWSCQTAFYAANMLVTTSTTTSGTTLSIDDAAFEASRNPLQSTVLDQSRFETAFLHENWTSMIYTADVNGQASYGGPSALLAALYDFNSSSLVDADSVVRNARSIKQRFFGEMVLATVAANTPISQTGQVTNTQRRVVVNLPIAVPLAVLFIVSAILVAVVLVLSSRRPLNLHNDPASTAAVAKLIQNNSTIYECFSSWEQNKHIELDEALASTRHFLDHGVLSSVKSVAETTEPPTRRVSRRRDWRPFAVRRIGGLLIFLLLVLIFAAILVLFIVAHTVGLYETAFTYQTELASSNIFTFAPYSIVPTLLAVVVTLWWDNLDETFRRLQPYVSMAQKSVPLTPIVGLSYLSTFSVTSVVKAAKNRHWLVALVAFGAVLAQVLTVSMSALWQRAAGSRPGEVTLTRILEPRTQPFVYKYSVGSGMGGGSDVGKDTLSDFYAHLSTNWLYSATLQLAYNGSEPPWSKDGWSFVPVELASISDSSVYKDTPSTNDSSSATVSTSAKNVNVTLITPALRGWVDCSALSSAANLSSWATEHDLTDRSVWNVSVNPSGLDKGFEIKGEMELGPEAALSTAPILARDRTILCCMNSSSTTDGTSALGYWSSNFAEYQMYNFQTDSGPYPRNFSMKWIKGTTANQYYMGNESWEGGHGEADDFRHLIWSEAPAMAALNCQPRIEWSNASVTVDMATNQVWDYTVVSTPETVDWPWSDVYLSHNYSEPGDGVDAGILHEQITVSFGVLFQDAMLFASDLQILWPSGGSTSTSVEDLDDKNFNFRRPEQGLNTDLMSYSMYQLANGDLDVLMDTEKMTELGQRVFTTFFQHFVSSNRSSSGSWAYQTIGATLPSDLGPVLNSSTDSGLSAYQDQNSTLTSDTNAKVHLEIAVEILEMSPVAVYISLIILFIMILIIILVSWVAYWHFRKLEHDFNDLASVISVVYDSQKLHDWIVAHPEPEEWTQKASAGLHIRLGEFVGSGGKETWGVEVVEDLKENKPAPSLFSSHQRSP